MTFRRFFLVRLAWALFGAWLATVAVFFIFFVISKAPERFFAGPQAAPAEVAAVERELRLSEPLYEQYYAFLWRFIENEPVSPYVIDSTGIAFESASATGSVVLPGMFLSLALGVPLGFAAARRRKRSRTGRLPVYVAVSLWPIWVGLWLALLFGEHLGWLPPGGYCDAFSPHSQAECGGAVDWAEALVLPWITFAIPFGAIYGYAVAMAGGADRGHTLVVLGQMLGRDVGAWMSLSVLLEIVFGIPGLGRMVIAGIEAFSAEWSAAALLMASLLAIAWHFAVNMLIAALDEALRREWPVASVRVPT